MADSSGLRIGFFAPSFYMPDVGGAEILMNRLACSLQDQGHAVVMVAPRRRGAAALAYPAVRTLPPFSKKCLTHPLLPLLYAWWRHRFEILHCQGELHAPWVARRFSRLTGVPYVVRATGGGFETAEQQPRYRSVIRVGLSGAARVVAQGDFLYRLIRDVGVADERIVTINNGVCIPDAGVDAGERPLPEPYFYYNGGFRPVKGYDLLVRAFSRVRAVLPGTCLVLAGRESERPGELRALLAECALTEDTVRCVGLLSREDGGRYLRHAVAFVAPYRYSPFPNAVLEALAHGTPVIASAVGGHLEQIRPDRNEGLLFPSEDVQALTEALITVGRDPERRAELATGARRRADDFSWEGMVGAYGTLYAEVIAESRAGMDAATAELRR